MDQELEPGNQFGGEQPKIQPKTFGEKYAVPLSILAGMSIIAYSIYASFGLLKKQTSDNPSSGVKQDIKVDGLPMLGDQRAPVTVVEFADFQCPYCGKFFHEVLPKLKTEYIDKGKVKFYFNDMAILGQESIDAAEAAKCAGDQGKFWQYHDYLYNHQRGENQGTFSVKNLKKFAQDLGLDTTSFGSCMDSKKYEKAVTEETTRGIDAGVEGTPTNFINGIMVGGAVPYNKFSSRIEQALKGK